MVKPLRIAEVLEARSQNRGPIPRFINQRLAQWMARHRHPFNLAIHAIGIPLAVTGVVLFFLVPWYWGLAALLGGYFLQWVGHQVEGNDVGEWAGIKRLLGFPYVGISPRWQREEAKSG